MCNRDNTHDVGIFPDEKIAKKSEPTNQVQTQINIAKGLKIYLNDLKNSKKSSYHLSRVSNMSCDS